MSLPTRLPRSAEWLLACVKISLEIFFVGGVHSENKMHKISRLKKNRVVVPPSVSEGHKIKKHKSSSHTAPPVIARFCTHPGLPISAALVSRRKMRTSGRDKIANPAPTTLESRYGFLWIHDYIPRALNHSGLWLQT